MTPAPAYPPSVQAVIDAAANGTATVADVQQAINAYLAGGGAPAVAPSCQGTGCTPTVNGTTLVTDGPAVAITTGGPVTSPLTGFNPLSAWVDDPIVSASLPIGWWELGIAVAGLLFMFGGGKR
jgi:hypothetical protein